MKRFYISILAAWLATSAVAQRATAVSVVDSAGRKLPFASISRADGATFVADSNGIFLIPAGQRWGKLLVSYAGYRSVEIQAGELSGRPIRLMPVPELKEVLVNAVKCWVIRCSTSCSTVIRKQTLRRQPVTAVVTPQVYPNPTRGELQFRSVGGLRALYLFDSQGRLLRQWDRPFDRDEGSLSVAGNPAGHYLLRLQFANGSTRTEKIILLP